MLLRLLVCILCYSTHESTVKGDRFSQSNHAELKITDSEKVFKCIPKRLKEGKYIEYRVDK